jgi:DNA-directed RNA polymerase specialized sigma24 family protein
MTARAPADTDALLHHPEVVRVIRAIVLEFGIRDQDAEDGIADVQMRALETTEPRDRPTDVRGWKALVRKVAYNVGREIVGRLCRRGKVNAGPTDGADEHATKSERSILEPHERAAIRAIVEDVLRAQAGGKHTGVMLAGMMTGAPPREMAQEAGIPSSQMRKQSSAFREMMRSRLVQAGVSIALITLLSMGSVKGYEHHQQVQARESFDSNAAPPREWHRSVEWVPLHTLPPAEKAAALREMAIDECGRKLWEQCASDLDMARAWDPSGEALPEVRELRKTLNRMFEAKPRTRR